MGRRLLAQSAMPSVGVAEHARYCSATIVVRHDYDRRAEPSDPAASIPGDHLSISGALFSASTCRGQAWRPSRGAASPASVRLVLNGNESRFACRATRPSALTLGVEARSRFQWLGTHSPFISTLVRAS